MTARLPQTVNSGAPVQATSRHSLGFFSPLKKRKRATFHRQVTIEIERNEKLPERNKNEASRWELESNKKASEWKDLENITVEQGPCGDKPPNTDTGQTCSSD